MKKYCMGLLLVLAGTAAFGQKAVMMGKVMDANGKPVAGAELKVTGHKAYYKVKTDNEGLYYTPAIDPVSYHVIIDANGKYYTTDRVKVAKLGSREFYNFVLADTHAELHEDEGSDAAMVAKIEKMEAEYLSTVEAAATAQKDEAETEEAPVERRRDRDRKEEAPVRRDGKTSVKIIPGEKVPQSK